MGWAGQTSWIHEAKPQILQNGKDRTKIIEQETSAHHQGSGVHASMSQWCLCKDKGGNNTVLSGWLYYYVICGVSLQCLLYEKYKVIIAWYQICLAG